MTYSEAAHKYLLKAFFKQTNKKGYKLQILIYNYHVKHYTNGQSTR